MCFLRLFKKKFIVGRDILLQETKEFYFTISSSCNPPEYQRYRFYEEEGHFFFFHEKREGDHWPLQEADAVEKATIKLTEAQWNQFFDLIKGGTVKKHVEKLNCGDKGPFIYLYWKGDRELYREYTFENYERCVAFKEFCNDLK